MRKLFTQKIFSAISSAMLLLQAFSPYMLAVPQAINIPVYAQTTEEATLVDGVVAMQIVETNQCFENSINGCDATVTTDKADYAPTEVVFITGTNFDPNTDYRLV